MQEVYPNSNAPPTQRRFLICLLFNMKYGGPGVCFLWLANQKLKLAIYSYINSTALIIQGIICLLFVISAFFSLTAFSTDRPRHLRLSHRFTWTIVILFLMNYFGNLVVFGVQKGDFLQWCVGKSRQETESYLFNSPPSNHTFLTSSHLNFIDRKNGMGLYNCSRLWEDEIKLSVIVFIIMFITYIHFAVCFWCYTQDRMREYEEALAFELTNSSMMHNHNNNMMMHNPSMMGGQNHNVMMNIPRAAKTKGQDSKRNLADITRNFFGNLRYSP